MIEVFPSKPQIVVSSYAIETAAKVRRTEFESGPTRQALAEALALNTVTVSVFCCDQDCYREVLDFLRYSIKRASDWFLMDLPHRAAYGEPDPVRVRVVEGKYSHKPEGDNPRMLAWRIEFDVEYWD